jgi:glycosyltransferase involved in cell wall biosynthesis
MPILKNLPLPPTDKTGWPWTEESNLLPERMPNGLEWPRISIVTPSYNQGQFIEETIRSVFLQGYPNLEYIVIDGGSNDNTKHILEKYSSCFSYWHSKPDKGQSNAINLGFSQANGEILAWLNSDDVYCKGVFEKIARIFKKNSSVRCITCPVIRETTSGEEICVTIPPSTAFEDIFHWTTYVPQAGVFFRKDLMNEVGFLDESLHIQMDYDLWFRFASRSTFFHTDFIAAKIKIHEDAKTTNKKFKALSHAESLAVKLRYADTQRRMKLFEELSGKIEKHETEKISFLMKVLKKLRKWDYIKLFSINRFSQ